MRRLPLMQTRASLRDDLPPMPDGFAADGLPPLVDAHGRAYAYLRLSVTDRCDLACVYCMPPGGEVEHGTRPELLTFEEAARVATVLSEMGTRRIRFTGGEPLVRKDVVQLVELVRRRSRAHDLVMTTNAMRLGDLARPLRHAGLAGVNVSLDSLDADRFQRLTRGGELGRVLAGVHAARDAGLEVKLNVVLLRGESEHEIERLVDFAWDLGATPRFIELMPIGEGAALARERFLPVSEVIARLGDRVDAPERHAVHGHGPARYVRARDGSGRRVGFITAVSDEFCDTCNRVRVTAQGDLRACLASRRAVSLRDLVRAGATDREVAWALSWALAGKDDGHRFLDVATLEHTHVGMSLVGG